MKEMKEVVAEEMVSRIVPNVAVESSLRVAETSVLSIVNSPNLVSSNLIMALSLVTSLPLKSKNFASFFNKAELFKMKIWRCLGWISSKIYRSSFMGLAIGGCVS